MPGNRLDFKGRSIITKRILPRKLRPILGLIDLFILPNMTNANSEYFEQIQRAAKAVDDYTQSRLGDIYHFGEDLQINFEQAAFWYQRAAE